MDRPAPSTKRTTPLTTAELRHFWWAMPPLGVLLVANLLFDLTGDGYGRVGAQLLAAGARDADLARDAVEAEASISWATLVLIYLAVSVGTTLGAWRIVNDRVAGRARRPFMAFAGGVALLGLLNLFVVDAAQLPLSAVVTVTLDALSSSPAMGFTRVTVVGSLIAFVNVMSVLVPAVLFAAAAASALPPVDGWNEATLVRRARQVRQVVGSAAAFMVAGVLHMGAWTHWAGATLVADADVTLDQVAASVTLFWGTAFTLMIASFYIPVTVRLGELAEAIMDDVGVDMADRVAWLSARGLSFRWNEQLPQIAAMAAPLLAAPLSGAIGTLSKSVAAG